MALMWRTLRRCAFQFLHGNLELQGVYRCIGLDRGTVDVRVCASNHSRIHVHRQYLNKHLFKDRLQEQLPGTAYDTVSRKLLIDIVADEVEDVQTHTAMLDKFVVADDIFQIPYKAQFGKRHWVDALADWPVKSFGKGANTAFKRL